MPESNIKTFNFQEFARDLTNQASQVIPADIQQQDAEFIVEIVFRFCNMAGEALAKEENSKLTAEEASLVVQFIGEWIFHKSIDLIRAKINVKYREGILQKVAFTVFDIAKKAVENQLPQEELITLVEAHVKKSFTKAIQELTTKGILNKEESQDALTQSNIDAMAQEQVEEDTENEISEMSDKKIIRLASFAILIKNFPMKKLKAILSKFNKPEREVLLRYLKMSDLEEKLDMEATMKCFKEIKDALPETVVVNYDNAYKKMCKIVKNSDKKEILDIIKDERPVIKKFVMSCYNGNKVKLPAMIADTISKYIEETHHSAADGL